MKTYQEYYNEWQNSTESRDLSFEEWLMLLLDRKENKMVTIDNWNDVRVLLETADRLLEKLDKKELLQIGATGYYSRVLVEYGKYKEMGIIKGTELELEEVRQRENEVY